MVGGLSLFAVVTGTITSAFVTRAQEMNRDSGEAALEDKLDALTAEVAALREQLVPRRLSAPARPPNDAGAHRTAGPRDLRRRSSFRA